ncbi:MAG: GNAT family N-acetyltransferase [Candidatus Lokiarchaeota archaeon]|nr:GNAT family N-acetyltransferase [Candidatus Lokiarchaeota archaeon]MBD3200051.1 GNAT family N-acetyltransferase [Candidatus Lokiarchaeota archaeon]
MSEKNIEESGKLKEEEKKEEEIIPFIRGDTLDLIPRNMDHIHLYFKWINDQDVRVFSRNEAPTTKEDIKKWFERPSHEGTPEHIGFELYHKQDKRVIGNGGLSRIDYVVRKANIWMVIGEKDYWGKGLATEAAKLILEYAFKEVNLNKVYAGIFEPNVGSWSCAEKVGFTLEGKIKKEIYVNGKYHDIKKYAYFQDDWLKK